VAQGNDHQAVYQAYRRAIQGEAGDASRPTVLLLHTVMGFGIPDIEDQAKYHGQALEMDKAEAALKLLDADNDLNIWAERRASSPPPAHRDAPPAVPVTLELGTPRDYTADNAPDNRAAYGNVLEDLAVLNNAGEAPKVVAITCDLEGSVKMNAFHAKSPHAFFEAGIQEHAAASIGGRLSREGFVTFFSTFGVFGVDEVYNQLRINDFNQSQLKVVCTHVGLSVGEDGPTHQCIDYLALLGALPGFRLIVPADANQTDRAIRYIAQAPGNFFVGLPRAKAPTVCNPDGTPRYAGDYTFTPGEADLVAPGDDPAICAIGPMVGAALEARATLAEQGIDAAVWNFASVDPLPADAVREAAKTGVIVTVEDHGVWGGLGSRIAERCVAWPVVLRKMGVRGYQTSGPASELYAAAGLSPSHIAETVASAVAAKQAGGAAFPSEAAAAAL
jgi:transketolase